MDRIFVEFADGSWVTTDNPDFQADLAEMVAQSGRPVLVEFRAAGEGYAPPSFCDDCGKGPADCHCDEQFCPACKDWYSVDVCPCDGRGRAELGTWSAIDSWEG